MNITNRIAIGLLFALATGRAFSSEVIKDFHSRIEIATNAELTVTETIRVTAEGNQIKHGIYRDFPNLYRGKFGLCTRTGFSVAGVKRDGKDEPWHSEKQANGVRVYIGNKNTMVSQGEHTYELIYKTDKQLGFFGDHDELYWNVTGNGWEFPIEHASADVHLPAGITVASREAYTGPQGSKGKDYTTGVEVAAPNAAAFETTKPLGYHEGLTIVVTWPPGHIQANARASDPLVLLRENPGIEIGIIGLIAVLFYYLAVWSMFGKDPARGTIVPLFGPPEGFSPAAVRDLSRMGFDTTCFAANLINLAVKGALTITKKDDLFSVARKGGATAKLLPDEKAMYDAMLSGGSKLDFKQTSHTRVSAALKALKLALSTSLEKIYFVKNSRYWTTGLLFTLVPLAISLIDAEEPGGAIFLLLWLSLWTVGVTAMVSGIVTQFRGGHFIRAIPLCLFATPFMIGECAGIIFLAFTAGYWVASLFVAGIVMNGVFYHLLKAPTKAGRKILDQIEGFKLFLTVSEKDRLNFENPPEKTPELFDKFLPYALALGVEQRWSEQFTEVLAAASARGEEYSPGWYTGAAFTAGSIGHFASSLGSSLSGAISSSSTAPGSSSGSGGGGSSGGGGGGGGGGGW